MKRRLLMLSVSLVVGIVLGMIGYQALNAQFGPDSGHTCGPECGAAV